MLGNSWVGEGGVYTGQLGAKPENWKRFQPHLQVSWEKGRVGLEGGDFVPTFYIKFVA